MINRDKLLGMCATHPTAMRTSMYRVISNSQDKPEVQVQAIGMALIATCSALNINVRELLETVERMRNDLDGPFSSTFRALEAYARNEIGSRL